MSRLATYIADLIFEKLSSIAQSGEAEIRLIFHGPPLDLMSQVYQILQAQPLPGNVPLLLLLPELPTGAVNPQPGVSGYCNDTHLLNLRNSPSRPAFLGLVPPGQHSMRSVTSTTDEFGLAAVNNGGNAPFEDWWADEFVQHLASVAISRAGIVEPSKGDEARFLMNKAGSAADSMDVRRTQRTAAWHLLSRIFAAGSGVHGLTAAQSISLACGFPPMRDSMVLSRLQASVLDKVAEAMADGFGEGIKRAKETASAEEARDLDDFLDHLRAVCDLPTPFERATPAFYAPDTGLDLPRPPAWWMHLTAERWSELLTEEAPAQGDITMTCANALLQLRKGMPIIVQDEVVLSFAVEAPDAAGTVVNITRGRSAQVGSVAVKANEETQVKDQPPSHKAPIRYSAAADNFNPGAVKIISLATWAPGLIVACRQARAMVPPRKPSRRGRSGPEFETTLTIPGGGRHELLVLTTPGIVLDQFASGIADDDQDPVGGADSLKVHSVPLGHYQIEVEADGNYQVDIGYTRTDTDGTAAHETCRVLITVEDVAEQGCRSEFERLIRVNRSAVEPSEAKAVVQLNRSSRSSGLQEWMLLAETVEFSYLPIVLADDYAEHWVQPSWSTGLGTVFSEGRFIHDPRPGISEFQPPPGFVEARKAIAAKVRGASDETGLMESAKLGKWLADDDDGFRDVIERYLDSYASWLKAEPDVACWVDVAMVTSLEDDQITISRTPDAIILSPLHPIRIAWHALAQRMLVETEHGVPCPAASVLDPDCIPDVLALALRSPDGIEKVEFLAVENGTDYWSVLWNGTRLGSLPTRSRLAPFGDAFGISVGGISVGFSSAQVGRALEDVSGLLAAKPVVGLVVASAGGTTDACNEGLISWCSNRYKDTEGRTPRHAAGPRFIEVYDHRDLTSQPDEATIANLAEDTNNSVKWFSRQPKNAKPDLGILAQLDMSEPSATSVTERSPLGFGGLLRHRVRRQLAGRGAFLSETRQSILSAASGDVLADKVAASIGKIESLGDRRVGMRFAPNVNAIRDMLERRNADFVAVSSSAIDPACFLGGWLEGAYLWDYDMPSYSHRAGDTNGYYLLSKVKDADREALGKALGRLPGCSAIEGDKVRDVLLEIARRGIPTIRGLAGDNNGATGDLGLFVAVRLLQDRFRLANIGDSLVPVISNDGEDTNVCIIVPVDPFRGYFSDIARSLGRDKKDISLSRPDFMVIGFRLSGERVDIHLTPIEVKCRPGSVFPAAEIDDALEQARTFSRLLTKLVPHDGQQAAWAMCFQHLLLSIIGFGMRVYSQHEDVVGREGLWSSIHERVAAAILGPDPCVSVDQRGRLIIVDESPRSVVKDRDDDGFEETVTIGTEDAGRIVAGDPLEFYEAVRNRVGNWALYPNPHHATVPAAVTQAPSSQADDAADQLSHGADNNGVVEEPAVAAQPQEPINDRTAEEKDGGVVLSIGKTIDSLRPSDLTLNISDTRLNNLNMGVVGDLGTGKTQLLKSLILQISSSAASNRGIKPRMLIFDYKRDYSSADFVQATGAKVVKPYRLPLNLFDTSTLEDVPAPWLDRFRFFADVLDKIYSGIGPVQRDKLKKAVKASYEGRLGDDPPTLTDVHAAYAELLDGKSDSPMAIIDDLIDMEIFASKASATISFDQFLDGVVVISLDSLGADDRSKNMLVAIMLNMFYENMLRTPKRPFLGTDPQLRAIDSYLLVDEADNIMRYEFDVLRKLLLQGREFGIGVILASQYLRHFKVNATDYRDPLLSWFIHKVPNVTVGELSALGLVGSAAEQAERIKSLKVHECLYKSFDAAGEIVRGLPFFELVAQKGDDPGSNGR
ncbi:ATP-binding protein [Ensifer sp. 2TAB8]|uniref:ATP-binding protein n=1 Tax=Ensifer sp. 2TAB8 TaxID=3233006 RepID=UPI003F90F33D